MIRVVRSVMLAAGAALLPAVAMAHTGVGEAGGFAHGFTHPLFGLDHVLAMVLVGLLAWQMGSLARWLVPASFVLVMAVGGAMGAFGVDVPFIETGIALSVIVLGAVIAAGLKVPMAVAMGLVAFFSIFHGHAHGAEMPETVDGLGYGVGFMLATALLHAAGLGLGVAISRIGATSAPLITRSAGGVVAVAGLGILAGVLG